MKWAQGIKRSSRAAGGCMLAVGGPFYKAFVVFSLWNWFLVGVVSNAEISYIEAVGLCMVVYVLTNRLTWKYEDEWRWKVILKYTEAITTAEAIAEIRKEATSQSEQFWSRYASPLGELFVDTVVFGLGWVFHTFLS